jgi:hypothetical protein
VRWLKKTLDINARGLHLIQTESGQTTSSEILALCTTLTTSITLQQTQLQDFLLTFYGIIYVPAVQDIGENEPDDDVVSTDTLFLHRLIGFEHRILAQSRQARKLKHPEVAIFAFSLRFPALDVIKLARSWLEILENETEDD